MAVNSAQILGHLGSDPEVKTFDNGDKIVNFSVATTDKWRDKDGNEQSNTDWHRIVVRKGLASVAERFLKKGMQVFIEGPMRTRSYQDKDGVTRYVTEIMCLKLEMTGSAPKADENQGQQNNDYQGGQTQGERNAMPHEKQHDAQGGFIGEVDDEIPFGNEH